MPTYDVSHRDIFYPWNVAAPPPGAPGNRPVASLEFARNFARAGQVVSIHALGHAASGAYADPVHPDGAFFVLERSAAGVWTHVRILHVVHGVAPTPQQWVALMNGVGQGSTLYGILVMCNEDAADAPPFLATAQQRIGAPPGNLWFYWPHAWTVDFGVNANGYVGERATGRAAP